MTDINFTSDFFWDPANPVSAEELTRQRMQRERMKMSGKPAKAVGARVIIKQQAGKPESTA